MSGRSEDRVGKRPLRILFYSESPVYGGAEEYVYQIARALGNGRYEFIFLHEESSELGDFPGRLAKEGVRIEALGMIRGKRDLAGFLRHVRRFRLLRPDIVHFNQSNPYSQQYSVIAARCAGLARLIATYHLTPARATRTLRGRCFERLVMALMRRIVVLSGQNREELYEAFPGSNGRVEIIPNGIEDPGPPARHELEELKSRLGIQEGQHVVAAAGRLTPQKGFAHLLDAAALLARRDIVFVIAGEGPLGGRLREKANKLGLGGSVIFSGFLRDVWKLFYASDLVAIPSLYEGQPLVLLEAMAAGRAVVASAVHGLAEGVVDGETGMLVSPGSAVLLARAIETLMGDRDLSSRMGERARARYEELFTARIFRERMELLYRTVAGGGS